MHDTQLTRIHSNTCKYTYLAKEIKAEEEISSIAQTPIWQKKKRINNFRMKGEVKAKLKHQTWGPSSPHYWSAVHHPSRPSQQSIVQISFSEAI